MNPEHQELVQLAERMLYEAEEAFRLDRSDANQRRVMRAWSAVRQARAAAQHADHPPEPGTLGTGPSLTRLKDGVAWRVGTHSEVAWIAANTGPGVTITAAIPPVFEAYATLVHPGDPGTARSYQDEHACDRALVALLERHTRPQPWWLGYLDTGASDIVFWDAPKVTLYTGWHYVIVQSGPAQALAWRPAGDWRNWKSTELPELVFPADRSWLVSTMWDDDWTCIGGPDALIDDLQQDAVLGRRARRVSVDQDATPPDHTAR